MFAVPVDVGPQIRTIEAPTIAELGKKYVPFPVTVVWVVELVLGTT
jgi:hypothetical protein